MKKAIVLFVSLFIITGCAGKDNGGINTEKSNETISENSKEASQVASETEKEQALLPEYSFLEDNLNITDYHLNTKVNNTNKRIILLANKQGKEKYKSIFIKKTNRLKIVAFDGGLIFNDIIS